MNLLGYIHAVDPRIKKAGNSANIIFREKYYKNRSVNDYDFIFVVGSDGYDSNMTEEKALYAVGDMGQGTFSPVFMHRNPQYVRIDWMETNTLKSVPMTILLYDYDFGISSIYGVDYTQFADESDGIVIFGVTQKIS